MPSAVLATGLLCLGLGTVAMYKLFFPFFEIDYLANHSHFAPTLGEWFYSEWKEFFGTATLRDVTARVQARAKVSSLPMALVALYEGQPVGTVSLRASADNNGGPQGAWLTGLYVQESYRNRGVGTLLMERIEEDARRLDYRYLQLWTYNAVGFYAKRGWELGEQAIRNKRKITIMRRSMWAGLGKRDTKIDVSRLAARLETLPSL